MRNLNLIEQRRLIMNDYETAKAIAVKLGLGK
jgi:hypothetical protein